MDPIDPSTPVHAPTGLSPIECLNHAVFQVGDEGGLLEVNETACRWLGYEREELLNMTVFDVNPTLRPQDWPALFENVREEKSKAYQTLHRRKDGSTFSVELITHHIESSGRGYLLTIVQDISQRLQVQQQLQRTVDQLNEAQRIAHIGNWEWDIRSGEVYWSDETYRIFGYQPGEIEVNDDVFFNHIHLEDRVELQKQLKAALEQHKPYFGEFRIMLRGEGVRYGICHGHSRGRCVYDDNGEPIRMYGTVQDVTERHHAEEALRRSEEHHRQDSQTNKRLLSEVNHRVRNNLTGLLALLRMVRAKATSVDQLADRMDLRIAGMNKVHNLLADAQWKTFGLHRLIRHISAGHCHPDSDTPNLHLDGTQTLITPRQAVPLAMALNELFVNCVKHGCYRVCKGWLEITWQHEDGHVVIDWQETHGPPITDPIIPSLGTELIDGFIRFELGGEVTLRYPETGACHTLRIPLTPQTDRESSQNDCSD